MISIEIIVSPRKLKPEIDYCVLTGYSLGILLLVPVWWAAAFMLFVLNYMLAQVAITPLKEEETSWVVIYPFTLQDKERGLSKAPLFLVSTISVIGAGLVTYKLGNWFYLAPIILAALLASWLLVRLTLFGQQEWFRS